MDKQWVKELHSQFPVAEKLAFFDIAYENCGNDFVRQALNTYMDHKADIRPGLVKAGGAGKGETIGVIADARERLRLFLQAGDIRNLAFTPNTCQAISDVLQGYPFAPEENIVVGDLEHVSVIMPCLYLKNKGVEVRVVPSNGMTLSAEELLEQVDGNTRIVVVSYVQSRSGYKVDLPYLVEECHKRGVYVVTDAIQGLGFQPFDVQAMGVDAVASSCYKGLLGVEGVGFLYVSDGLLSKLRPVTAGDSPALSIDRDSWEIKGADAIDARKFESGTIPFQAIYGLRAGIGKLLEIGLEEIGAHISDCFETVYKGLTDLGYDILTPLDPKHRCHSMAVKVDNAAGMVDYFLEHGVFISKGVDRYVRVAIGPFTTEADMEKLFQVAKAWKEQG